MTRRDFITLLVGAAAAWPLAARGGGPRPRIAVLELSSPQGDLIAAFVDALRALGYVEGKPWTSTTAMPKATPPG